MKTFELRFKNKDGIITTAYLYDPSRDYDGNHINYYKNEAEKLAFEINAYSPAEEIIIVIDGHPIRYKRDD